MTEGSLKKQQKRCSVLPLFSDRENDGAQIGDALARCLKLPPCAVLNDFIWPELLLTFQRATPEITAACAARSHPTSSHIDVLSRDLRIQTCWSHCRLQLAFSLASWADMSWVELMSVDITILELSSGQSHVCDPVVRPDLLVSLCFFFFFF